MFQYLSRFKFVKNVSIASIAVFIGFGLLRLSQGVTVWVYIDFIIALVLTANLWLLMKRHFLLLASHILIAFLSLSSIFLYLSGGIENSGNIPLLSVPLFTYFVLGKRDAERWMVPYTLIFILITALLISGALHSPYSSAIIRQTAIFYFLILWVSSLFESLNFNSQKQIIQQAETLKAYNYELTCSIDEKTKVISKIRESMDESIEKEVRRRKTKDQIYFQQSRQQYIAEMLAMISDKWREPLFYISSIINSTKQMIDEDKLSVKSIESSMYQVETAIEELSGIIESFHSFYQPSDEKEYFFVHISVKNALMMMEKSLSQADIHMNLCLDDGLEVAGFRSEFEQVIVNLLSNAKRALRAKKEGELWMEIIVKAEVIDELTFACITVSDNGGGISTGLLENLFSAKVHQNREDHSMIGLYMSKEIIEGQMHGTITASNYTDLIGGEPRSGAKFEIILPLSIRRHS